MRESEAADMSTIKDNHVGEVWPVAEPGDSQFLYGSATVTPTGEFEARSLQSFTLVYTVGRFGLDDSGEIKIVHRFSTDWGWLQMDDPKAVNYVTAKASNGSPLRIFYNPNGHQRPWYHVLTIQVKGNGLREGDTITVIFGDRSGGSPGLKLQSFCESDFKFKVLADVCATGHFLPIPDTPSISIVPGPVARWKVVLPSLRRPGEVFRLGIKAEDLWGNPTGRARETLRFTTTLPVDGLPDELLYGPDQRSVVIDGLTIKQEGILRVSIVNDEGKVAESNPLVIRAGSTSGYWGDMHGQSGETVGINTAREYFEFARNLSFLDATGHQANDFQVNNAFWKLINDLSWEYQEDHRFVTFPGYEWSGNTAVGGDRNVYFRNEGRQIHRSSHALLPDRDDIHTDAKTAGELFESLQDEDCVVYAHVGGRFADIAQAHDPRLETAMEIHSAWGTFEWLLTDGFDLGHRSGVVCNSDGHKGRPGASYPGAASFGAYGGLTCFLSEELTRDGLFKCLRRRHHYGTTGNRLHLDVRAQFATKGRHYEKDPRYFNVDADNVNEVMMGDIAQTDDHVVALRIECITQTPVERIDVLNGKEVVTTLRGYQESELGNRIRIIWQGAEYRGRGRQTVWQGRAHFPSSRIIRFSRINAWNHERVIQQQGDCTIDWEALTTGNFGGIDTWIDESPSGKVEIETNHVSGSFSLSDIGFEDTLLDAGALERKIRVYRLPPDITCREYCNTVDIPLKPRGDNPIWVRITTEDGFNAWSSPIFLFREGSL